MRGVKSSKPKALKISMLTHLLLPESTVIPLAFVRFHGHTDGMGCQGSNTDFIDDINCGAKTFVDRYKEAVNRFSNSSEFFHDIAREVRHGYLCATPNKTYCTPEEKDEGKGPIVTFFVKNRVTEVQYRYTNWTETEPGVGGVYLFNAIWEGYSTFNWSR